MPWQKAFVLAALVLSNSLSAVTKQQLEDAASQSTQWISHGRDYAETRFSPLKQITTENVDQLKLAWYADLTRSTGLEATPLVADGVLYTTGHWNVVLAFDAATGEELWRYDPLTDREVAIDLCCSVADRGVALLEDKLFTGLLDGRLLALDRKTGELVWETQTVDRSKGYSITGAPRVIKDLVVIGNGGADMGPVRGYVSAYDAQTGALRWRFYTVPGDPSQPFENPAMEMAAKTWHGPWWTMGGGGTVWDSMAYDPQLDLLYIGVGNGVPWSHLLRSEGKGDNLFLSSIVALRPDTGEYVWHYQTTPGDTWDYTATQQIILTELELNGRERKVLLQAPKNGYFYILDRETGELLSAEPYAQQTWTTGIDKESGRPIIAPGARFHHTSAHIMPSMIGAHNWQSMALNPETGLVYLPIREGFATFRSMPSPYRYMPDQMFTGNAGFEELEPVDPALGRLLNPGFLLAWNPSTQQEAWRVLGGSWDGGVLATGGGLVFQGNAEAEFAAYDAKSGAKLWSFDAQTGIIAAPISYEIDGKQYVAIMAGWGGAGGLFLGHLYPKAVGPNRLLVFNLDGKQSLPREAQRPKPQKPQAVTAEPELLQRGKELYFTYCARCHGTNMVNGVLPDLRYSAPSILENYERILTEGGLLHRGMPNFWRSLTREDAKAIREYVLLRANEDYSACCERAN